MIHQFLNQSYPFGSSHKSKVRIIFGFSFFVFAFLAIFKPFGLAPFCFLNLLIISLGYGTVCGMALALNFYGVLPLLSTYFDEDHWTVGRQLLWFSAIVLTASIFNTIYAAAMGLFSFSLTQFLVFIGYGILIGIFPLCAVVVFDYWRLLKKHKKEAEQLKAKLKNAFRDEHKKLVLISANQKERLQLKQSQLLYLTSEDNYVGVFYRKKGGTQKKLLRGSLKSFEKQLKHSPVIRCHRSYIVNLLQVHNISSNAQGYLLKLPHINHSIPVSRSYSDIVLSQITI